jgi:NAD(P)-dependent dehydrogenase (short-subunit alcohol dehydrogenase family)
LTAVVTGGAGGLGRAVARRLASDSTVLLVDVDDRVRSVAEEIGARSCVADLGAADAWERVATAVDEIGEPLSLLVNNAGITRDGRCMKLSVEDFRAVVRINLVSPLRLIEKLAPTMGAEAAVVNIASRAALGNFGQANYVASKSGLIGATRSLAVRLAPAIRVNAIAPGLIDTPMTAAMPTEVLSKLVGRVPAGRAGEPEEVAEMVAFLGSKRASYITGQTIFVCGGRSLA